MTDFKKTPLGETPENRLDFPGRELRTQGILLLFVCFFAILFVFTFFQNQGMKSALQKSDSKIQIYKEVSEERSEIEVFGSLADEYRKNAEVTLISINQKYIEIEELESIYEIQILSKKCIKEQIDRMVEGEDYSKDFCLEPQNLEIFREPKK